MQSAVLAYIFAPRSTRNVDSIGLFAWHIPCCPDFGRPWPGNEGESHDRQVQHRASWLAGRRCRRCDDAGSRRYGQRAEASGARLHLRRPARRLRLQPGARRSGRRSEEDGWREGRRRREGPGDGRRREIDGEHDQPRRRHADLPDLVRLLRPAHAEGSGEVSQDRVPSLRRPVGPGQAPDEHGQLLRLHRRGAVSLRHRRGLRQQVGASWASSPPSRSRRSCATSMPSRWARSRSTRRSPRR